MVISVFQRRRSEVRIQSFLLSVVAWYCLYANPHPLLAQSSTEASQVAPASASTPVDDSRSSIPEYFAQASLALEGYCAVSILDERKWVKGDENFGVILDGRKYLFPDREKQQRFLKHTTKYTPALSCDCIVSYADQELRRPGSLRSTAVHRGRLYLFHSDREKALFMKEPSRYEDVDLAFQGLCAVCFVDEQQRVSGESEFGTVVGGMRFYFSDAEHRKAFLKDKARYIAATMRE